MDSLVHWHRGGRLDIILLKDGVDTRGSHFLMHCSLFSLFLLHTNLHVTFSTLFLASTFLKMKLNGKKQ